MVALPPGSRVTLDSARTVAKLEFGPRRSVAALHLVPAEDAAQLRQAAQAGHVSAMYRLGLESADRREREHWLREAAHEGYVPAMYYWGLVCDDPRESERWLTEAARNGCQAAVAELCDD